MDSREVLQLLKDGNALFAAGACRNPRRNVADRTGLVAGQHPLAAVLTCSDSRVPPELMFDHGLGDLFVVRNAGNVVEPFVTASMEYAAEHLCVSLIAVIGHTHCGALKAAGGGGEHDGALGALIGHIRADMPDPTMAQAAPDAFALYNATRSVKDLLRSPVLRDLSSQKRLTVVGGVYDLETGIVRFCEDNSPSGDPGAVPQTQHQMSAHRI